MYKEKAIKKNIKEQLILRPENERILILWVMSKMPVFHRLNLGKLTAGTKSSFFSHASLEKFTAQKRENWRA